MKSQIFNYKLATASICCRGHRARISGSLR